MRYSRQEAGNFNGICHPMHLRSDSITRNLKKLYREDPKKRSSFIYPRKRNSAKQSWYTRHDIDYRWNPALSLFSKLYVE